VNTVLLAESIKRVKHLRACTNTILSAEYAYSLLSQQGAVIRELVEALSNMHLADGWEDEDSFLREQALTLSAPLVKKEGE
jgi:hypothetical protein